MNGPDASVGGVVHRRMFSIVKLRDVMSTTKILISVLAASALIWSAIKQLTNHCASLNLSIILLVAMLRAYEGRGGVEHADCQEALSFILFSPIYDQPVS